VRRQPRRRQLRKEPDGDRPGGSLYSQASSASIARTHRTVIAEAISGNNSKSIYSSCLCEVLCMRGTIGLFKHGVGFRMFSHRWDFLSRHAAKPEKRSERRSIRIEKYPEQAEGLSSSLTCAVTSDRRAPVKLDFSCTWRVTPFDSGARPYPPLSTSGLKTSRSRTFLRQSPRNSSPRNTCSMRFSRAGLALLAQTIDRPAVIRSREE
jgi:hypothetical protein